MPALAVHQMDTLAFIHGPSNTGPHDLIHPSGTIFVHMATPAFGHTCDAMEMAHGYGKDYVRAHL